jgi:endonuclease/exonuclease/phosphatase family metal-dependent hydrolase
MNHKQDLWLPIAVTALLSACAILNEDPLPTPVAENRQTVARSAASYRPAEITVMTLNLAHGRAEGLHQILQSGNQARNNLDVITSLLDRESPDLIAFQEADAASAWSGRFCHPCYLSEQADYGYGWQGRHASGFGVAYGTTLLSRLPLVKPAARTFAATFFGTPKGFVSAAFRWPGTDLEVQAISVHLDPLRADVRRRQLAVLTEEFADRRQPLIMAGDFNTIWGDDLRRLAETLDLHVYQPESQQLVSFPRRGRRLDWILISRHFDFLSYRTLPDPVSDHRAVIARLQLSDLRR